MKKKLYLLFLVVCAGIYSVSAQTEIVVRPTDNLIQFVADAADGDILVLQAGYYKANADYIVVADKNITLQAAPGGEMPKVYFERIELEGANVGLTLDGIEFSGYQIDSLTGEEDTEGELVGEYFLNLAGTLTSFTDIVVKNCIIRNVSRAVIRADRSNYTGDGFEFDNCIISDQRDDFDNNFGPFRLKGNLTFNYFTLKNSTIYNVKNRMINCEEITNHIDVLIDNCTFYNISGKMPSGNNYMFDFKVNQDMNFTTKDCIFGKTNDDPSEYPDSIKGWRFAEDGPTLNTIMMTTVFAPDFVVNYSGLNDVVWDQKVYVEEDVDPGFADPENADFTLPLGSDLLESSETGGIIGDPRWSPVASDINDEVLNRKPFEIYPNPTTSIVYIYTDKKQNISFLSVLGKEIKIIKVNEGRNEINVSDLSPGIYIIKSQYNSDFKRLIIK